MTTRLTSLTLRLYHLSGVHISVWAKAISSVDLSQQGAYALLGNWSNTKKHDVAHVEFHPDPDTTLLPDAEQALAQIASPKRRRKKASPYAAIPVAQDFSYFENLRSYNEHIDCAVNITDTLEEGVALVVGVTVFDNDQRQGGGSFKAALIGHVEASLMQDNPMLDLHGVAIGLNTVNFHLDYVVTSLQRDPHLSKIANEDQKSKLYNPFYAAALFVSVMLRGNYDPRPVKETARATEIFPRDKIIYNGQTVEPPGAVALALELPNGVWLLGAIGGGQKRIVMADVSAENLNGGANWDAFLEDQAGKLEIAAATYRILAQAWRQANNHKGENA